MKLAALDALVCPTCKADLGVQAVTDEEREILEGTLTCSSCHAQYPIRGGVPRFVPDGLYANSFGRQWNWFRTVQLDSETGTSRSEEALRGATEGRRGLRHRPDHGGRRGLSKHRSARRRPSHPGRHFCPAVPSGHLRSRVLN